MTYKGIINDVFNKYLDPRYAHYKNITRLRRELIRTIELAKYEIGYYNVKILLGEDFDNLDL